MRLRNHALFVSVVAMVTGLAMAFPSAAQERQVGLQIVNRGGARSIALRDLQTLGADHGVTEKSMRAVVTTIACESECVYLDSYNPNNTYNPSAPGSNFINVVKTVNSLQQGQSYVITITGTISYWAAGVWQPTTIGVPESSPMFLSPDVPTGNQLDVGLDWEYVFAYPNNSHGDFLSGGPLHAIFQGISLDNGNTYFDLTPLGGQTYHANHSYQYVVEGQGQRAAFLVSDAGPHSDNYGRYQICVQQLISCSN